jgi:biotin-dependent carboxylase-like uncharacterized protein
MMIRVLHPGLYTTVQDEGRNKYLAFGMPKAGVMDRYSARMANLLCGNPFSAAVLEIAMGGGRFQFEQTGRIAVCGAEAELKLNENRIQTWTAVDVSEGDILEISAATLGLRNYLAISGGVDVPVVMGSRSTYSRAGIGGFEGRPLKAGDRLPVGQALPMTAAPIGVPPEFIPSISSEISLRVLLGPQDNLFASQGIETFLNSCYTVSNDVDRMGYRLEGTPIEHINGADIISDALAPGAVQVPGNGNPIVMMVDCGTTGGYAKIATVISSDLAKISQAQPQDCIRFVQCTDEEAIQAYRDEMECYRKVAECVAKGIPAKAVHASKGKQMKISIEGQIFNVEIEEVM